MTFIYKPKSTTPQEFTDEEALHFKDQFLISSSCFIHSTHFTFDNPGVVMIGLDSDHAPCLETKGSDRPLSMFLSEYATRETCLGLILDKKRAQRHECFMFLLREYLVHLPTTVIHIITDYCLRRPTPPVYIEIDWDSLTNRHSFEKLVKHTDKCLTKLFQHTKYVLYPSKESVQNWNNRFDKGKQFRFSPEKHHTTMMHAIRILTEVSKYKLETHSIVSNFSSDGNN
jgi:hypothetical protein